MLKFILLALAIGVIYWLYYESKKAPTLNDDDPEHPKWE